MKPNQDLKSVIEKSCFFTWQIAEKLGVHENTFYRWMRTELPDDKKEKVMNAIAELNEGMQKKGDVK